MSTQLQWIHGLCHVRTCTPNCTGMVSLELFEEWIDVIIFCKVRCIVRYGCATDRPSKPGSQARWLRFNYEMEQVTWPLAQPGGGGLQGFPPPKAKLTKHRFCRYDIKGFTWFTLRPNSATKIGWCPVYYNIEKYNKNIRICSFFLFQLVLDFPVT
jgi:hypothetical protein